MRNRNIHLVVLPFLLVFSLDTFPQTTQETYQYPDLQPATLVNGELTVYCIRHIEAQQLLGEYQASLRLLNDSFPFRFEATHITPTSGCDPFTSYTHGLLTGTVLVKENALTELPYRYTLTFEKINRDNHYEFIINPENLYQIIEGIRDISAIEGKPVQLPYQRVTQEVHIELRAAQTNKLLTIPTIKEDMVEFIPSITGTQVIELIDHTTRQIDYFTLTVNPASVTAPPFCEETTTVPCVDSNSKQIILNGNSISSPSPEGVNVNDHGATITSAGTYTLIGTLSDGQIIVDTEDDASVTLILNGVTLNSSKSSPFFVRRAKNVVLVLSKDTENRLTDGMSYVFENAEEDEPDATLFSKSDLTIEGEGSLIVTAHYNDGIKSKDELTIAHGTLTVNAVNDGIQGKDSLMITGGTLNVEVNGDGLKSTHDEDSSLGYVTIQGGNINVISGGDAIQAETYVTLSDGTFTLTSGGGSEATISEDSSAKGIKANTAITIDGGTFLIHSADDAVHANERITLNAGQFTIASGDDGFHADSVLEIYHGEINISKSYEGIESSNITLHDGTIHLLSEDDGINVSGGTDQSSPGPFRPPVVGNGALGIHGGYITVDSHGDGLDVNGSITMTNGTVIVNGPTSNGNGAIDYDGSFDISGGYLLAVGSSGMAQAPSRTSTQYSFLIHLTSSLQAGTLIHIETPEGEDMVTFAPSKKYHSIVLSSAKLLNGSNYDIYYGGTSTGAIMDGLYKGGTYTPGTKYASLTVSGIVTTMKNR